MAGAALLLVACREGEPVPLLTASPAPTPSGPPPDARTAAIGPLLQPGARLDRVLYGRLLPGPGEQIVLHSSRDIGCPDRQDYLQVFAFDPALGRWDANFDARRWPSASEPVILDREDRSGRCREREEVRTLALMDLDGDGLLELVLGLATGEDGREGTFWLEILSFAAGVAEPLYEQRAEHGGAVTVRPQRVELEQPTFPTRSGPLWRGEETPNGLLREAIAWDGALGQAVVVERENTLFCAQGVVERASREALFVMCDVGGRRVTGFRVRQETRVLPEEVGGVERLQPGREVSVRVEGSEADEEDRVNPVAVEIVVMNQRHASVPEADR